MMSLETWPLENCPDCKENTFKYDPDKLIFYCTNPSCKCNINVKYIESGEEIDKEKRFLRDMIELNYR